MVGIAAAQLAGQDFLVGLDRVRADAAGQALSPVPGLASTTAAGLARRMSDQRRAGVEAGLTRASARMLTLVPAARRAALCRTDAGMWFIQYKCDSKSNKKFDLVPTGSSSQCYLVQ